MLKHLGDIIHKKFISPKYNYFIEVRAGLLINQNN